MEESYEVIVAFRLLAMGHSLEDVEDRTLSCDLMSLARFSVANSMQIVSVSKLAPLAEAQEIYDAQIACESMGG